MGFRAFAVIRENQTDSTGKALFNLQQDLVYETLDGMTCIVKKEHKPSDLGSIPRNFWWLISPHKYPSAYILHDMLCDDPTVSRLRGDQILKEALIASGAPTWKVELIYLAVRVYAKVKGFK